MNQCRKILSNHTQSNVSLRTLLDPGGDLGQSADPFLELDQLREVLERLRAQSGADECHEVEQEQVGCRHLKISCRFGIHFMTLYAK